MSGAGIILLINLAIAALFCVSFVLIAFYDRRYRSARWFAATFATGMTYALVEYFMPIFTSISVGVFAGHMAFLLTLILLNLGLARHYGIAPPLSTMTVITVVSVVAVTLLQEMPRDSHLRNFLYQGPYFLMQSVGFYIVVKAMSARRARHGPVDVALAIFLCLSALHYLSKPFLVSALGGSGATSRDYIGTTYAMVSQSMGTVLVVIMALLLLAMLIVDMVKDITTRLETDLLSGLLNRRGFEERLDDIVRRAPDRGMPVTLVICDLDHFKKINDTWGHAAGDRVIAAFADILRAGAADNHVLGRIGGEEFAILLPRANLVAGRLFAEAARTAFASHSIDGFPPEKRFTASFGVAEFICGDTTASLSARADGALYEAKRTGRDRVRAGHPDLAPQQSRACDQAG